MDSAFLSRSQPAGRAIRQDRDVDPESDGEYWNHNTAFHPEILRRCAATTGDVLDVGCGDGLLVARIAGTGRSVVGIERDTGAAELARRRCAELPRVTIVESGFEQAQLEPGSFGFVTMVATLHHLDTAAALTRAADLLHPGGRLYVLGLVRIASKRDVAGAIVSIPRSLVVGAVRREHWPDGVPIADPEETFDELAREVRTTLPGARLRRRAYYRYSLEWTKNGS